MVEEAHRNSVIVAYHELVKAKIIDPMDAEEFIRWARWAELLEREGDRGKCRFCGERTYPDMTLCDKCWRKAEGEIHGEKDPETTQDGGEKVQDRSLSLPHHAKKTKIPTGRPPFTP